MVDPWCAANTVFVVHHDLVLGILIRLRVRFRLYITDRHPVDEIKLFVALLPMILFKVIHCVVSLVLIIRSLFVFLLLIHRSRTYNETKNMGLEKRLLKLCQKRMNATYFLLLHCDFLCGPVCLPWRGKILNWCFGLFKSQTMIVGVVVAIRVVLTPVASSSLCCYQLLVRSLFNLLIDSSLIRTGFARNVSLFSLSLILLICN